MDDERVAWNGELRGDERRLGHGEGIGEVLGKRGRGVFEEVSSKRDLWIFCNVFRDTRDREPMIVDDLNNFKFDRVFFFFFLL